MNHPNILTIHEIGESNSILFIATELIDGETLRQRMTKARLKLTDAIDVAIQVASALAAAHVAGRAKCQRPEGPKYPPQYYALSEPVGL